ncbi:hypothetical protein [Stappia sp. TSB10GB4]|uniref:hypothetical protein n=1 Tax=Stappia sp. TSB10GB4 TaxID=2003584 RepID=UPI001647B2BC|nr:hypothetical protein [Stappia sp. TSB10GB4]
MRVLFSDLARPKQAAKNLVRLSANPKLSDVHEALARVLGYRDWHELSISAYPVTSSVFRETSIDDAVRIIVGLADDLSLTYADVQYAISKARLLQDAPWPLEVHLSLCTKIWRQCVFGAPGSGKPGTVVRDKANGANTPAYLRRAGEPTYLLSDTGMSLRADHEVVTPGTPLADFVPSRLWLPYGFWTLQDGSVVIFSRDYLPMWRVKEGIVERLNPWIWVNGIADQFFFTNSAATVVWSRGPARELALDYLATHRIFDLPKLVDIMPYLFEAGVESIEDGVKRLREMSGGGEILPTYAKLNTRLFR